MTSADEVPVVGLREPCPCGSGRRYKACHGRAAAHRGEQRVSRPFEGLPSEGDWVAMRELVPSATARLRVPSAPDRIVTVATVLPMAWPGLVRTDGEVFLGLQTPTGSGDPSRDLADALQRALASDAGTPIPPEGLPDAGPRLQDLIDCTAPFEVRVHDGFDFWIDGVAEPAGEVGESLARVRQDVVPTVRLERVESAYWCRIGEREHLRWVLPHDEERGLDALARLHGAGELALDAGSRFIGSFRALGLIAPVWDLPLGTGVEPLEDLAVAWLARFEEAFASDAPLTGKERGARSGLLNRQVTLT